MCAYMNVMINVSGIGDDDKQSEIENRANQIRSEGEKLYKRAINSITTILEDD